MRYFLCLFLPPIAVLTTGKIGAFFLNLLLTFLAVIPGIIHAFMVVSRYYADQRNKKMIKAVNQQGGQQIKQGDVKVQVNTPAPARILRVG